MRAIAAALVLVFAAAAALAQAPVASAPYRVIVHPHNPVVSADRRFIADAFLKKIVRWRHGESIRPVDLENSPVRRRFSDEVLGRSASAIRSYWQQQIFSGRNVPPPELENDQAVVRFVLRNPGAIGYVSGQAELAGARVLQVR
jgi:ABC-type phosphate transport system substrate-binding protein